jgi:hypothetical protein
MSGDGRGTSTIQRQAVRRFSRIMNAGENPMTWKFVVYASRNRVVEQKGGFATGQEALAAGQERAEQLKSSADPPGGQDILSVDATPEK